MSEDRVRVIEAGGAPARDRDGLHRRRGIWHFKVRVGGRWRELSTGERNWQAARAKRREMLAAVEAGRLPGEMAKWPLAKALEHWLDSRAHDTAPSSQRRYRELVRALAAHFPARRLADISAADIAAYQVERLKSVSPRSVNLELRGLRMVLKKAKLWARLADDYKPVREPSQGPGRALAPEEEKRLFSTAASRPEWHVAYCCAIVAANTTARGGELRGLRLGDVDLFNRNMRIRRASTKTDAGARMVTLNDAAAWALARLQERAQALGAIAPEHFLLPLALYRLTKESEPCEGKGFDASRPTLGWRSAWRSLTKAAGLPGLRFHDLRHHAITKMAEAGVPDHTIMSLAGHVSRAMLEHYSHVRTEAKRAAVAAINVGAPIQDAAPSQPAATPAIVQ